MSKQLKWVELEFSFHRRFERGEEPVPEYNREHFFYSDPDNKNDSWRWEHEPEAYQVAFSLGTPAGLALQPGHEAMFISAPLKTPNFHSGFTADGLEDVEFFPFSLIDMDLFVFKNTDRITGRLNITNKGTHFEVLADFATMPPYVFNEYKEVFLVKTNEEFEEIVNKLNRLFAEVTEREHR